MRHRLKLTIVTLVWLSSQMAAFLAPTMATCVDHDHAARGGAHVCCEGMEPGQVCPMHPHSIRAGDDVPPGDDRPAMRCVCHASDAGLATLLGATAILPLDFVLPFTPRTSAVTIVEMGRRPHSPTAEIPPPRA
jgi:hypothetical protein